MPASHNPVIFVHGYSDSGKSWGPWREILRRRLGVEDVPTRTCSYISLNNEITIKDIAEAFDRALIAQGGLDPTSLLTRSCIRPGCWSCAPGSRPTRCAPSG